MTLIAIALCLIMLTTVGTGVVAAKQTENPRQAGASSIYLYDVAATDSHGTGKLQINVDKHTFVFNGKGLDPNTLYVLRYRIESSTDFRVFASGKATPSGNLHVAGTWEAGAALPSAPGFGVSAGAAVGDRYSGTLTDYSQTGLYYVFKTDDGSAFHLYLSNPVAGSLIGDRATASINAINADGSYDVFCRVQVSNMGLDYQHAKMVPVVS